MQYKKYFLCAVLVCVSVASAESVVGWTSFSTTDTVLKVLNKESSGSKRGIVGTATGSSGVGVEGNATGSGSAGMVADGVSYGIHANSATGIGVRGLTTSGEAVHATVTGSTGTAVVAEGKSYGVEATAFDVNPVAVSGAASSSESGGYAYGVKGTATADHSYGVYGAACCDTTNWAGYFSGSTFATGSYIGSDRMLKKNIRPITEGLSKVMELKPSTYEMRTDEFKGRMNLPRGQQYGLIAQELETVFPAMVKTTIEPAILSREEKEKGVKRDPVTFKSVNYNALIPILIRAIQEQQAEIEALKASR